MTNRDGPPRLAEGDPTVGSLVRSALPLPARSPSARQLVKWQIRRTLGGRAVRGRALRPFVLAALLLASGVVLGAAGQRLVRRGPSVAPAEIAPPARPRRHVRAPSIERAPTPAEVVDPFAAEETPAVEERPAPEEIVRPEEMPRPEITPQAPVVSRAVRRALPEVEPPAPSEVAPPPQMPPAAPLPDEQALLRTALARLRMESDPAGSLEALDERAARFPGGALAPEALALRAEALVQLGLRREALRVLDAPVLAGMPGAEARRALHGELQAALGRWREARHDFDRVIAGGGDDAALERAFWGRAVARQELGDPEGARADLRECLRRFPRGPFSSRAAAALRQLP